MESTKGKVGDYLMNGQVFGKTVARSKQVDLTNVKKTQGTHVIHFHGLHLSEIWWQLQEQLNNNHG